MNETGIPCFKCKKRSGIDCAGRKPDESTLCHQCLKERLAEDAKLQARHLASYMDGVADVGGRQKAHFESPQSNQHNNLHSDKVFTALENAHKKHPELRLGQLVVVAAEKVAGKAPVFYLPDEDMAAGLEMMADEPLQNDAAEKAERIGFYLTRKIGTILDGETTDGIARIIRRNP